jgi:hypothetical protein
MERRRSDMSPRIETTPDAGESASAGAPRVSGEREVARRCVQARRDLASHFVAYVVVNLFLVAVWAFTGAGYFWPAWVIFVWGSGLVLHAWDVFFRRPVTEADVDTELSRHQH